MRNYIQFKDQAIAFRRSGKTYTEIQDILRVNIPPSTLCTWFQGVTFSDEEKKRMAMHGKERIRLGNMKAVATKRLKQQQCDEELLRRNYYLKDLIENKDVAKISLIILYLCEGSKNTKGSLCLGNSNPNIIRLFLYLLRKCYAIDEKRFRCTVQHRADQDAKSLKVFWSEVTDIPITQFYGYQPDKRTIGFPTKKVDYKGVCRIDYLSTAVYNEVRTISGLFL